MTSSPSSPFLLLLLLTLSLTLHLSLSLILTFLASLLAGKGRKASESGVSTARLQGEKMRWWW